MPTKPGGGDHPENYDEETGKYVSSGRFKAPNNLLAESQKHQNDTGFRAKVIQKIKDNVPFEKYTEKELRTYIDIKLNSKLGNYTLAQLAKKHPFLGVSASIKENKNEWMDEHGVDFILGGKYIDLKTATNSNHVGVSLFTTDLGDFGFGALLLDDPKSEFFTDKYLFQFIYDDKNYENNLQRCQNIKQGNFGLESTSACYVDSKKFNAAIIEKFGGRDNIFDEAQYFINVFKSSSENRGSFKSKKMPGFKYVIEQTANGGGYSVQLSIPVDFIDDFYNKNKNTSYFIKNIFAK